MSVRARFAVDDIGPVKDSAGGENVVGDHHENQVEEEENEARTSSLNCSWPSTSYD